MELLILLAILAAIFFVFILPAMVIGLSGRVKRLEEELSDLRVTLRRASRGDESGGDEVAPELVLELPKEEGAVAEPEQPSAVVVSPPALPIRVTEEQLDEELPRMKEPVLSKVPTPLPGPSPVSEWLDKMGLKPPGVEDEGANPMAWWSTRVGLGFGVIAAVFLGMYVNQDTVPWVRLLELVLVAVAVFVAGCWFERKLAGFGGALSAGGLALLYVSAYAAYGLPAMKVIESPLVGTLVQAAVLVLTAGWALWKGKEAIFGLALVLGYVTCSFAAVKGLEPVPLLALVLLALMGTCLFAWRGWWSGLWGAVIGSGLGLSVLAILTWNLEKGPSQPMALATMLALTLFPLVALGLRWLGGESRIKRVVPGVTSVGLFSGAIVTATRGFDFELFYASFAILLFVAGWWWRRDGKEGIWQTLWAKAMVLVALFVITRFEGPVRAFALLGQAGGLIWLARTRGRVVFEIGAALALLAGWFLLWSDSRPKDLPWVERWPAILYLIATQALLVFHRYRVGQDSVRRLAGVFFATLVALEVVNVSFFGEEEKWLILIPLAFGFLSLIQHWPLKLKDAEWTPFVILLATLGTLLFAVGEGAEVPAQAALWTACAGSFYAWWGRSEKPRHRLACGVLLAGSLAAIWCLMTATVGADWLPVAFVGLAVAWQGLGQAFKYESLRDFSLLAGVLGGGLLWDDGWQAGFDTVVFATLILSLIWWGLGWVTKGNDALQQVPEYVRTAVLGIALWALMDGLLDGFAAALVVGVVGALGLVAWRFLRAESLSWLGLIYLILGAGRLLDQSGHGAYEWGIALYFVLLMGQGILLAHSGSKDLLARPKVASMLWGIGAMAIVLVGLVIPASVVSWVTASWALAAVVLLASGFWFGLRAYRIIALAGLLATVGRLFSVDIQDSFWRIVAFGITGALLVGIGYLYNRFHQRLADGDLDWGKEDEVETDMPL